MNPKSERSNPQRKPRFPRLSLLHRRRREDRKIQWYCAVDIEGMVHVRTPRTH